MSFARIIPLLLLVGAGAGAQAPNDPFPNPINATAGIVKVNFVEFASLPDLGGQQPSRPMLLVDEPGTRRLFVNDMRGPLYTISRDGKSVSLYRDIIMLQLGRTETIINRELTDELTAAGEASSPAETGSWMTILWSPQGSTHALR